MAQLDFQVGKTGHKSVSLCATIPPLSKHDLGKKIPFEIRLPDGRVVKGELDSPLDLMVAQARIQVQHATRDLVFPEPAKIASSGNGSAYKE